MNTQEGMTIKQIADVANVTERTVRAWIKEASERLPKVSGKTSEARANSIPAHFTLEETIEIIKAGGRETLAALLEDNARKSQAENALTPREPKSLALAQGGNQDPSSALATTHIMATKHFLDHIKEKDQIVKEKDREISELHKQIEQLKIQVKYLEDVEIRLAAVKTEMVWVRRSVVQEWMKLSDTALRHASEKQKWISRKAKWNGHCVTEFAVESLPAYLKDRYVQYIKELRETQFQVKPEASYDK